MNKMTRAKASIPALEALADGVWRQPVLIRFSHCDPAGIVYFAKYFDIANGVVEDWFAAALRLRYHDFIGPRRTGLGFVNVACDFVRPGMMGDEVVFAVVVEGIGTASIRLVIYAYREGEPVLAMRLVMVTTSLQANRAIPVPDDLRHAIETYKENCR
jgi:acyl-CoA thioesterase FadM